MNDTQCPFIPGGAEYENLYSEVSDLGKEAMGMRPRYLYGAPFADLMQARVSFLLQVREDLEAERAEQQAHDAATVRALTRTEWTIGDFFAL